MVRLLFIFALLALVSCKPTEVIYQKTVKDTTIIREIPRIIHVPGAEIRTQPLNIDSLAALLRAGVPGSVISKTTIQYDPDTKMRVGILIDELGNLTAICEQQERMIEILEQEITRLRQEKETTVQIKETSIIQQFKNVIFSSLIIITVVAVLLFLVKKYL